LDNSVFTARVRHKAIYWKAQGAGLWVDGSAPTGYLCSDLGIGRSPGDAQGSPPAPLPSAVEHGCDQTANSCGPLAGARAAAQRSRGPSNVPQLHCLMQFCLGKIFFCHCFNSEFSFAIQNCTLFFQSTICQFLHVNFTSKAVLCPYRL